VTNELLQDVGNVACPIWAGLCKSRDQSPKQSKCKSKVKGSGRGRPLHTGHLYESSMLLRRTFLPGRSGCGEKAVVPRITF
jgi:hypothetical protein